MSDACEIDGFCTDCGNWTDLHGPIGDRRCRCGSGRVAVPPAGYRILGPDEVDAVTDAMVEAACLAWINAPSPLEDSMRAALKAAMEAGR